MSARLDEESVAREVKNATDDEDLRALGGVVQSALEHVYLSVDGHIAGMTPGVRVALHGHTLPFSVDPAETPVAAGETNGHATSLAL